jgi:hypothetical protein
MSLLAGDILRSGNVRAIDATIEQREERHVSLGVSRKRELLRNKLSVLKNEASPERA